MDSFWRCDIGVCVEFCWMTYAGIDGCKYGWILMKSNKDKIEYGGIFTSIQILLETHQDLDRILIDMPLGLSAKGKVRTLESFMKKELKTRHSTVFNAPCRESLSAKNHRDASQINKEIEGKGISIQTFFISNKIAEVDNLIKKNKDLKNKIIESHPEICFKYLNEGIIVKSKKSSLEGIKERLNILQRYDSNLIELYNTVKENTKRKFVTKDDIVDSICLCLVNKWSGKINMSFITDPLIKDEFGIKMRIGYYKNILPNT